MALAECVQGVSVVTNWSVANRLSEMACNEDVPTVEDGVFSARCFRGRTKMLRDGSLVLRTGRFQPPPEAFMRKLIDDFRSSSFFIGLLMLFPCSLKFVPLSEQIRACMDLLFVFSSEVMKYSPLLFSALKHRTLSFF